MYYSKTTNGFYPAEMRQDYEKAGTWPDDAIELTEQEVETYQGKQPPVGKQLGSVDGRPAWVDLPKPTLEQLVASKSQEIDSKAQQYIDSLTPKYPEFEKLTFEKQEQEARAYLADSAVDTPVLTAIATARGLTVAELATRVVTKADQLTQLASVVAGKRQAYQDRLTAATTVEEVEAITVDYGV